MQQLNEQFKNILEQKMDRKDFLKHVGVGLVGLTGVGALMRAFGGNGSSTTGHRGYGYGGSTYGGARQEV